LSKHERYRHFRENQWKLPESSVPHEFREKVAAEIQTAHDAAGRSLAFFEALSSAKAETLDRNGKP